MKAITIFIAFILVNSSYETIFKQIINAKALKYERFHNIDYKIILLPSNLNDLTISINFVRWVGFLALCPKSINITAILQYGTFPLFQYDSKFQNNMTDSEKISLFMHYPKTTNNSMTFTLKAPKSGTWFFGTIFDSNDDFNHYVICSADVRVEIIGLITPPSMVVLLTRAASPLAIPLPITNSESLLLEIKSNEPLSRLKIVLLCQTNAVIISTAIDSVPPIRTIVEAKRHREIYKSNDIVMDLVRPQMSLRLLLQIRAVYGKVTNAQLLVNFIRTSNDSNTDLLPPATIIKENTMFTYRFSLLESESKTIPIALKAGKMMTQPFFIEPLKDQGGVLSIDVTISRSGSESYGNGSIYVCVSSSGFYTTDGVIDLVAANEQCLWWNLISVASKTVISRSFYYPRWGWWYVNIMAEGRDRSSLWKADLRISSSRCKPDRVLCNGNGICLLSAFDNGLVSSCHCFLSFYGLDCKNKFPLDSSITQHSIHRRKWLVLSNLAFIPAIIMAAIQRIYLLSVVYTITMSFSMVYHVCSMDDLGIKACVLPAEQLTYYDHIAASFSIWVSFVALTTLSSKIQSMLNVSMIFALIVMGYNIQKSVWMYAAPVTIGLGLIAICWIYRMYCLKCIFPPIDWWMFGLVPGTSLVIAGFIFFRLSTYERYQYFLYHSIWHILISLSICFILPNTSRWDKALKKSPSRHLIGSDDLGSRSQRWRKFKKNINYYLHLDIVIDYLVLRNPNCSILKSY